ncbi:rhomboid family intramembrane serine protease [Pseudoroseicyclus tamaricis]|uniref:Rhomboid family intramembrane serine protease n=1 Tax=Pseudoroseicyclus tamaricis TaxID=2705421 RepID=A0A6B2K6R7_9RHOB|nr:rhomboid family intramembrane serine protease [Pseudoroseicyclus tamaricis]NDV02616.1 rhomboid family intramembrane serine protease [Pseudoroseicyclus tamaricis]
MFPIRDHNPSERTPYVTWVLMAANIGVWLLQMAMVQSDEALAFLYYNYAMIPARITNGEAYHTLLTSIFLHAGFMHLAGNMLFLWIFGDNLEDQMGHGPFLLFYLAAGVGAGLAQFLAAPWSPIPTVGASGAIAGVMGGYLLLFPRARVDMLLFLVFIIRIFRWPAWVMLIVWFGIQLVSGVGAPADQGGVAYWAHAGGFALGLVLTLPVFLRRGGPAFWSRTHGEPPHPEARYKLERTSVPRVTRRR